MFFALLRKSYVYEMGQLAENSICLTIPQNGFSEKNTFLFYPFISMYNTLGYVKK